MAWIFDGCSEVQFFISGKLCLVCNRPLRHKQTRINTQIHTHNRTRSCTQEHKHTITTHTLIHMHARYAYSNINTQEPNIHSQTHTYKHLNTLTNTQTQICAYTLSHDHHPRGNTHTNMRTFIHARSIQKNTNTHKRT